MNPIVKFFHELIHPHCQHCDRLRIEELEQRELDREIAVVINVCQSCENLKMQLAVANQRVDNLIDKLIEKPEETKPVQAQENPRIIQTGRHIPFNVTRQRLETESRLKAQELRQEADAKSRSAKPDIEKLESKVAEIKELEDELGIDNGSKTVNS